MAHQPQLNSLHSFYDFPVKPPCPSSTSLKIKTLLQDYIFRHVSHVVRALASAKSMLMELVNKKCNSTNNIYDIKLRKRKKKKLFRSIKMHFNWSSSHVIPMSELPTVDGFDMNHAYYDSTWNSMISAEEGDEDVDPPLSGYLHWLDERKTDQNLGMDDDDSEIDRLAEKFIAQCHEKFRLEKQESYRRYQEMLARSI